MCAIVLDKLPIVAEIKAALHSLSDSAPGWSGTALCRGRAGYFWRLCSGGWRSEVQQGGQIGGHVGFATILILADWWCDWCSFLSSRDQRLFAPRFCFSRDDQGCTLGCWTSSQIKRAADESGWCLRWQCWKLSCSRKMQLSVGLHPHMQIRGHCRCTIPDSKRHFLASWQILKKTKVPNKLF